MRIRDIVMIGMMSAILIAVQVALGFLPNIELVSLLIIIYTLIFRYKTLYIIYVFVIVEGFIYGFGIWWFNYLYVWTVLFLITLLLHKYRSPLIWAVVSGFFGLGFGALCALTTLVISGPSAAVSYWIAGIPFDITHGISNMVIALILFYPLYYILDKLYRRTEQLA